MYTVGMACIMGLILIIFGYTNVSYLYTNTLVDMANRVALQFENTMESSMMEMYFTESRTGYFQQQLDDLHKYSRPEKVNIFVVFPNGVTSRYNNEEERITFEVLPPEFIKIFRRTVQENSMVTEFPGLENDFLRWSVAVPIRSSAGLTGGMVITTIFTKDVFRQFAPLLAGMGFTIILSFFFFSRTQKGFADILQKPLNNITFALENWSLSGYSRGIESSRSDEIGRLARTLDELALQLEEEQKQRDEEQESRRNFFHDISHELRTPVTALRAQVELIRDGMALEEELPGYYDQILKETLYLQELVDDLLTLSRLQSPGYVMEKEPWTVTGILKDIYLSMSPVASEKGIGLIFRHEPKSEDTRVLGNYTRLRQLFMIFVENSIKYSQSGTSIMITLRENLYSYVVEIKDEGCGIPRQDMDKIFKRRYRASNTGGIEGTGLGLQIAKELAELLDCRLHLESEENKGTIVTIEIARLT